MTQKPQTYVRARARLASLAQRPFRTICLIALITLGVNGASAQSGQHFTSFENGAVLKLAGTWNYGMAGEQRSQHQEDDRTFRFLADGKTLLTGTKPVRQGADGLPAPSQFQVETSYSALRINDTKTRIQYRDGGDNWQIDLDFGSERRGSYTGEVRLNSDTQIHFRGTFTLNQP